MPTAAAIDREFPGAIDAYRYVQCTTELLEPHGFDADNTIACVGVCRDELARPLVEDVVDAWGEAFNFSSLAGMLTLGRTGFTAARTHAPQLAGHERFVFIAMPHIGVDRDGALGRVQRYGQELPTPACGALIALVEELRVGGAADDLDPDDIEYSLLRRRMRPHVDPNELDIASVTRAAREAIIEDLERLIADADMSATDYAVFSGIQIHTARGELVWPAAGYVVAAGKRTELPATMFRGNGED